LKKQKIDDEIKEKEAEMKMKDSTWYKIKVS